MELVTRKNSLLALASVLVVALAVMAIVSQRKPAPKILTADEKLQQEVQQIKTQSSSDDVNSIQKDLDSTDVSSSDKELQNIDSELNKP